MKIHTLLLLVLIAFGCSSSEKDIPLSIEHAECLFSFAFGGYPEREADEVNFKDCEGNWKWEQSERWNICEAQDFYYRVEFNEVDLYVINMFYNASGSGVFTNLILIEIKDNVFKLVESIAGGDRCQHGIVSEEVKFKDKNLFYSELITPYHLMSWYNTELPFDAYHDCMVCCIGSVNYKYNPETRQKEFISLELMADKSEGEDAFSKTHNYYIKQGKRILNENDIKNFIYLVENE